VNQRQQVLIERHLLIDYVYQSLQIKKGVIEFDEFDKGERNKFNYGHTFGHALESLTDYAIKHGQAVTVGMDMANYLSVQHGIMDRRIFDRAHSVLVLNFPDYDWGHIDLTDYIRYLSKDKKNVGSDLVCILAEAPGRLVKQRIVMDDFFRKSLQDYFLTVLSAGTNRQG